jgi:hypothetical protein
VSKIVGRKEHFFNKLPLILNHNYHKKDRGELSGYIVRWSGYRPKYDSFVEISDSKNMIELINEYNLTLPDSFFKAGKKPHKLIGSNGFEPKTETGSSCSLSTLVIKEPMACQLNAASVYCNSKLAETFEEFIEQQRKNFGDFK